MKNDPGPILAKLSETERDFVRAIAGSERYVLLEVLRSADVAGYLKAFEPTRKVPGAPGFIDIALGGLPRAIALLSPAGLQGPGIMWGPPNLDQATTVNSFLYRTGLASHVRRLAHLARQGLAEFEQRDDGACRFTILAEDYEAIDRGAIEWHAAHLRRDSAPLIAAHRSANKRWVDAELRARVSVDPRFGIRYTSSRELEAYFETYAGLRADSLPGHDALPLECRLGPLTFGQYRTAAVVGMARALKHLAFVDTLARRDPRLDRRLVTTLFSEDEKIGGEWGGLLGLDGEQTRALLEVMGISGMDAPDLEGSFDCPNAMLVRAGDGFWHQPIYGAVSNPFDWMTRKLRRMFRPDWDRSVDLREAAYRADLERLFAEPRFYFHPSTPRLRDSTGDRTNIDALILDRNAGTLAVVQIKWQDPFHTSLSERASRIKNLAKEGNKWIQTVVDHCAGCDDPAMARRLGLPAVEAARVTNTKFYVLTRNGARFSGPQQQDERAAWISWFELVRLLDGTRRHDDPIGEIWRQAREARPPKPRKHVDKFRVDGLDIEVVHAAARS